MWARLIEMFLGCWLAMSPFIFEYPEQRTELWALALGSSAAIILLASISFWPPLRRLHLLELIVGATLIASSYLLVSPPPSPPIQNHVILGILIMMVAIIPPAATHPPRGWTDSTRERA